MIKKVDLRSVVFLLNNNIIELKEAGVEFEAGMGGEVIKDILKTIDLDLDNKNLRRELKAATTEANRVKIIKRLKVIESMLSPTIDLIGL